jgi:hypothetical protein
MKRKRVIAAIIVISLLSLAATVLANPPAESQEPDEIQDIIVSLIDPQDALAAAKTWAEGVKTRNGALQYAMMDSDLKAKYYDEFVAANWTTGVSSPWIEKYEVIERYKGTNGTYRYQVKFHYTDSTKAVFYTEAYVTVREVEGHWLICALERVEAKGKITQVTLGDGSKVRGIFVVADAVDRGSYDQANVIIDSDTKIYKGYTNQELEAHDLKIGTTVAVTFTDDPRIMIYPVQARARVIRVMDLDSQDSAVIYDNAEFGFSIVLPASWEGYQIVTEQWEGYSLEEQQSGEQAGAGGSGNIEAGEAAKTGQLPLSGPIIYIRHPLWTAEDPRQDIPIMIFTIGQWEALQEDKFHIGAAPIGPKELGRNSRYVFALPARYNFAFLTGFEEVEAILESGALRAY